MSIYAHMPNKWAESTNENSNGFVNGCIEPPCGEPMLIEKAFKSVEFANKIDDLISGVQDTLFGEEDRKEEQDSELESISDCLDRTNDKLYGCITRLQHLSEIIGVQVIK